MFGQARLLKCLLTTLALFVFSPHAHARDVEIAYAVNVEGKVDKGKVERCRVGDQCRIVSKDTGLTISIYPRERRTRIHVWGEVDCCYFWNGDDSVSVDLHEPLHRFNIYKGRGRKRNEVILNQKIGELYVGFKEPN